MKNVSYFMLKSLFVLETFLFLFWLFGYAEKWFDEKDRLISKYLTSQTGQQIITTHTLPNMSRSKGNQAMKFGQIVKYSVISLSMF